MEITRQADYAIRAILFLAENEHNGRAVTSLIAAKKKIPPSFLAKIIAQLGMAGLVATSRGARGGVSLAKPSHEISLLDVVEAIDGPLSINECALELSVCSFGNECLAGPVWCKLQQELSERLRAVKFDQLVHPTPATGATRSISSSAVPTGEDCP
jgi:Rrf2 family protein